MESSQDEEECRSSESGWTMYLGSPMEDSGSADGGDDDDEQDQEAEEQSNLYDVGIVHGAGEEEDRGGGNEDDGNGRNSDSDDSMASDASSRPRCPRFWAKSDENGKQGKGTVQGRGKVRKNLKMGKK
ncbi:hypothetical protein MLD38_028016 [Melastoma candidum]|uniref:Uncharacterized protein n=1 Tax=Melastoma candidum TaxID=119954 RepID=A0ACB9MZU5_9MYRT|nr:hypothetical protein MLD38_028016 [Melastoma candidum]